MAPRPAGAGPMVGRERERSTVDEVLTGTAAGAGSVLLVGGDAGIGKSTLVSYATARAADLGFRVLEGSCLDLSVTVPFAPVLEAVRPLVGDATAGPPGPARAVLARAVAGDQVPAGRLLVTLREAVTTAAREAPVLVVLEDLHWAEPSTRDFAVAMARNLPPSTSLLLTYRAEDVPRGHPLRQTLNDVSTAAGSVRVDLRPLGRREIAWLVEQRTGRRPDPAYVGDLLVRSEGNPLFAGELIASQADAHEVPAHLADLLLARLDALPAPAREMLRAASVDGSRLDPDLLDAVLGRPAAGIESGIRQARDARVVVQHAGRLEFRHALLRDAVYDDLLPGERARLHAACASALRARQDPPTDLAQASRLAHHLRAAGDLPGAFVASLRAGALASPLSETSSLHYERALQLWDRVPDPETLAGTARSDVLRLAAECYEFGDRQPRGVALIREALARLGPDPDPLLACRVYTGYAGFWRGVGDEDGELDAIEKALQYAKDVDSDELSRALRVKSRLAMRHGRSHEGLALARRARAVARSVGAAAAEGQAQFHVALAHMDCGHVAAAYAAMRACIPLKVTTDDVVAAVVTDGTLAALALQAGHLPTALAAARRGADAGRAAGLPEELYCRTQEIQALICAGELDRAQRLLTDLVERGGFDGDEHFLLSDLLLARGDAAGARAAEERWILVSSELPLDHSESADPPRQVAVFCAAGDVARALDRAGWYLRAAVGSECVPFRAAAALAGAAASAAAAEADVPVPPDLAALVGRVLDGLGSGDGYPWEGTLIAAQLATARAHRQRSAGGGSPAAWEAAVGAWRRIGFGPRALAATVPLVEDLLAAGDRDRAVELLTSGWDEARALGAGGVAADLERLGRRARVPLGDALPGAGGVRARLTRREREILDLVAAGASNREVATALFISEKTVSVHMSNLMAKLGVPNRREASALVLAERGEP